MGSGPAELFVTLQKAHSSRKRNLSVRARALHVAEHRPFSWWGGGVAHLYLSVSFITRRVPTVLLHTISVGPPHQSMLRSRKFSYKTKRNVAVPSESDWELLQTVTKCLQLQSSICPPIFFLSLCESSSNRWPLEKSATRLFFSAPYFNKNVS